MPGESGKKHKRMKQKIFTFIPLFKSTIWGGEKISRFKNEPPTAAAIGESWEISAVPGHETRVASGDDARLRLDELCRKYGAELLGHKCVEQHGDTFPLLVKIIDAARDLSVQVHPDDRLAQARHGCPGKTEMWYVVACDKGARINCGLTKQIPEGKLREIVEHGELKNYIASYESAPGDCFYIPAGRIHSIGAGNLLVEIQQSSDITYRIDDFGRRDADGNLRELHLDLAADAIDNSVIPDYRTPYKATSGTPDKLVDSKFFKTDLLKLTPGEEYTLSPSDSFTIFVCVDGDVTLQGDSCEPVKIEKGHSALAAACCRKISVTDGGSGATILMLTI